MVERKDLSIGEQEEREKEITERRRDVAPEWRRLLVPRPSIVIYQDESYTAEIERLEGEMAVEGLDGSRIMF